MEIVYIKITCVWSRIRKIFLRQQIFILEYLSKDNEALSVGYFCRLYADTSQIFEKIIRHLFKHYIFFCRRLLDMPESIVRNLRSDTFVKNNNDYLMLLYICCNVDELLRFLQRHLLTFHDIWDFHTRSLYFFKKASRNNQIMINL